LDNIFTFIWSLSQLFGGVFSYQKQNVFIFTKYNLVGQWKHWKYCMFVS